jgi:phage replication O-like protein O
MANVQLENGYTKIANEILEEVAKIKLSPTQYRLLLVIWRFTYGFNRKEHNMSLKFFSKATGCDSRQIQRELKSLEEKRVIFQNIKSGSYRKISFNKNHNEWIGKKAPIGEITIGETDNSTGGGNVNGTSGETDNQERNKKKSKETDDQMDKPVPYLEYEKLFGTPSPILAESFIYWIERSQFQEPEEIICETIKRAKLQTPKKPAAYVESILKNLHDLELYTLAAVKEHNTKYDANIRNKKSGEVPALSDMFDKSKSVGKTLTDEELQEINVMEEEFPF